MDFTHLADKIAKVLERECDTFEEMAPVDARGAAWSFVLDGSLTGFIGCEDNREDLAIDTVTIALAIGDLTDVTTDELLGMLETNSHFFEVALTATKVGDDSFHTLFLQRRIPAELYEARDFREHVDFMRSQLKLFVAS